MVDTTTGELHIVELDATGETRGVVDWPMPDGFSCPVVSMDSTGIYFSFPDRLTEPGPQGLTVYRLAPGELSQVARFPPSDVHPSYAWMAGGASPLVRLGSTSGPTFARWENETWLPLTGGPFPGDRIPSSDGRVFLRQIEAGQLRISEIVCRSGQP
ncbi:hypothetical protein [Sorangium sp. So ce1000]|uniref:hypothetical protein n=1 Tax=Sorangium sp. So ce1000 TaxID=3133325 RepID=UPI003F61DF7D